jgi:hypothetical protein
MRAKFQSKNLNERENLSDLDIDMIILEWILKKYGVAMCTGLVYLGVPTTGGLF